MLGAEASTSVFMFAWILDTGVLLSIEHMKIFRWRADTFMTAHLCRENSCCRPLLNTKKFSATWSAHNERLKNSELPKIVEGSILVIVHIQRKARILC